MNHYCQILGRSMQNYVVGYIIPMFSMLLSTPTIQLEEISFTFSFISLRYSTTYQKFFSAIDCRHYLLSTTITAYLHVHKPMEKNVTSSVHFGC